jgi:hypothetical protein
LFLKMTKRFLGIFQNKLEMIKYNADNAQEYQQYNHGFYMKTESLLRQIEVDH